MILTAKYVFPISQKPIEDAGVLIHGNKIAAVASAANLLRLHPDEEVKDFGQAAIMPGFINLHSRLERTLLRGTVADEPYASWLLKYVHLISKMSKQDKYDSACIGCLEAIRTGITTLADISFTDGSVRAINEFNMRGVVYHDICSPDKARVSDVMDKVERDLDAWEQIGDSERLSVGISPSPAFETHPLVFTESAKLSRKRDIALQLRLGGSVEELEFISRGTSMFKSPKKNYVELNYVQTPPWLPFGVRPCEFVKNWGAFEADNISVVHAIHVDDNDIRTLRDAKVGICSCPGSEAQLGMGVAPIYEFRQAGIPVGFGSDTPAASETHGMLPEMRFAMLLHRANNFKKFFKSSTVLRMGTLGAAQVLHMDDKIGTLEAGKYADIVAVDLSHSMQIIDINPVSAVINSCTAGDVVFTMVNGKVLYCDNEFTFDANVEGVFEKVKKTRDKLISEI